jgi:hypothetical protein
MRRDRLIASQCYDARRPEAQRGDGGGFIRCSFIATPCYTAVLQSGWILTASVSHREIGFPFWTAGLNLQRFTCAVTSRSIALQPPRLRTLIAPTVPSARRCASRTGGIGAAPGHAALTSEPSGSGREIQTGGVIRAEAGADACTDGGVPPPARTAARMMSERPERCSAMSRLGLRWTGCSAWR